MDQVCSTKLGKLRRMKAAALKDGPSRNLLVFDLFYPLFKLARCHSYIFANIQDLPDFSKLKEKIDEEENKLPDKLVFHEQAYLYYLIMSIFAHSFIETLIRKIPVDFVLYTNDSATNVLELFRL